MAWNLHAIEQMQLRGRRRVDGVERPKFDFHTACDVASVSESFVARTCVEIKFWTLHDATSSLLLICSMACRFHAIDARLCLHSCVCSMAFRLTKGSAIILRIS